jgi:carboxyl-terminal processing protease
MKSLVLDLRGNPGGLLPQAIEVVSRFVPRGQTVVSVKGRSRYAQSQDLRAVGDRTEDLPLVVMINGVRLRLRKSSRARFRITGAASSSAATAFGKGTGSESLPASVRNRLDAHDGALLHAVRTLLQKDYSSGSIYDYYTSHDDEDEANNDQKPKPVGSPMKTAGGRVFNSGRGIEPDIKAPALAFTPLRFRLNDAAFFFVRQLVAGQIKGFENFRVDKQNYNQTVAADRFAN